MLFVGILKLDRSKDREFWACLWQGKAPDDLKIIGAYNLMTDTRVIVFHAKTTDAIRHLDRFNLVGQWSVHPSLDQTRGYVAAMNNDAEDVGAMLLERGAPAEYVEQLKIDRQRFIDAPSVDEAMKLAKDMIWY